MSVELSPPPPPLLKGVGVSSHVQQPMRSAAPRHRYDRPVVYAKLCTAHVANLRRHNSRSRPRSWPPRSVCDADLRGLQVRADC
jgi:hypothetical protein